MQKFSIKNRYNLTIIGTISTPQNPIGCAFVLHGLGGIKENGHIQAIADTLFANNYIVINFDATNSIGESDGAYESATMQKHYEDLVDVITWAKSQEWYIEHFIVTGHSLGGYAAAKYAEDCPNQVRAVFAFAPVISGKLSFEATAAFEPEKFIAWKEEGWTTRISNTKPGLELYLPWSHMEERLLHDLLPETSKLTMPILIVVGEEDGLCPPDHQQLFFNMLSKNPKNKLHIVPGAPHSFREEKRIQELKNVLDTWLKTI